MAVSDKQNPPAGTIQVDPEEGFGPHVTERFLDFYGEGSVFVTATVDCLNHRFASVLMKSGGLPADHVALQYGTPEMRGSLESLLKALAIQGLSKPPVLLMRSATGYEEPQQFISTASSILGAELVTNWMHLLEQEDYAGADALLSIH